MKKLICSLLVFIVAFGLFASAAPSLGDGRSWIPESVLIGTGNDKWAFGLSRNNDDQLSYSGNIRVEAPVWDLILDLNGYTNRGWKDAWYTGKSDATDAGFYQNRYDTIDLAFALRWFPFSTDHWQMEVSPRIGFLMAGNYGFVWFQNLVHKLGHIHLVDLPYEKGNIFAPKFSAELSFSGFWGLPIEREKTTNYGASVFFNTENNIGFETSQHVGLELFLERDSEKLLTLSFGYIWYQQYTDWKTQELTLRFQQGPRLGFTVNAGVVSVDYWHALKSTDGYTVYSIDVMAFFQKSSWKENDLLITMANSYFMKDNYRTLEFQKRLFDSRWSVLATNRYIAGNPTNAKVEQTTDPDQLSRLKKGFSIWTVGVKYEVPDSWSKGWCTPFVSLNLGFEHWELTELKNMIHTATEPWEVSSEYTFIMDAEIGVSLVPEGLLKAGNASYRLLVSGGLSWIPQADKVAYILNANNLIGLYPGKIEKVRYFIPRLTVGLQIGFDL